MFKLLKALFKSSAPMSDIRPNLITLDTLRNDITKTLSIHPEYEEYMLSAEQILDLLNLINEPVLPVLESNTKSTYFESDGYINKEDSYTDKIDEILDSISDETDLKKIRKHIDKLQSTLTKFKEFLYSRGALGKQEYLSGHEYDFTESRDRLKECLLTDYPFNHLHK